MFGIGQTELIIVCIIVLILFGNRLPGVMFSLGKGIKDFKKGINAPDVEEDLPQPATSAVKKD